MKLNSLIVDTLMCLTRDESTLNHYEQVKTFIYAGAKLIQLRSKSLSQGELFHQAKLSAEFCKMHDCILLINDYHQLAKDIDADGVHLGMTDAPVELVRNLLPPEKIIGKTVHSISEAQASISEKPDYIGLGPYRLSSTKKDLQPVLSDEEIKQIINQVSPTPVFLIGGLTEDDFPLINQFHIQGLALCSSLFSGSSPADKISQVIKRSKSLQTTATFS